MLTVGCLICKHLLHTCRVVLALHIEQVTVHLIKSIVRVFIPTLIVYLGIAYLKLLAVGAHGITVWLYFRSLLFFSTVN